jgi:hypothetical protein
MIGACGCMWMGLKHVSSRMLGCDGMGMDDEPPQLRSDLRTPSFAGGSAIVEARRRMGSELEGLVWSVSGNLKQ